MSFQLVDLVSLPLPITNLNSTMTISSAQKTEIEAVIKAICDATVPRRKRQLAQVFLDLVDRDSWPEYYEVSLKLHSFQSAETD